MPAAEVAIPEKERYTYAALPKGIPYQLIDPLEGSVEAYQNAGETLDRCQRAEGEDEIASRVLDGFSVRLRDAFQPTTSGSLSKTNCSTVGL